MTVKVKAGAAARPPKKETEQDQPTPPEGEAGTDDTDRPPPGNAKRTDVEFFAEVYDRVTVQGQSAMGGKGGSIIPRREVTFTVDGSMCAPGVFADDQGSYVDFSLTMVSLTSAEEMTAMRQIEDVKDAASTPYLLAKASVRAINGKVLDFAQKDFLWEALAGGGRQLCILAYGQIGSVTPEAMGKFQSEYTVG